MEEVTPEEAKGNVPERKLSSLSEGEVNLEELKQLEADYVAQRQKLEQNDKQKQDKIEFKGDISSILISPGAVDQSEVNPKF